MVNAAVAVGAFVRRTHVRREVVERTGAAAQIRRGPAGKQFAVLQRLRRECQRHHQHGAAHAGLSSDASRKPRLPEGVSRRCRRRRACPGFVPVANDAHADASADGVVSRRLQRAVPRELLHVRQLALVHEVADEIGIESVEAEHDELLMVLWRSLSGARRVTTDRQSDKQRTCHWQCVGKDASITSCERWASTSDSVASVSRSATSTRTLARPLMTIDVAGLRRRRATRCRRSYAVRGRRRRALDDCRRPAGPARRFAERSDAAGRRVHRRTETTHIGIRIVTTDERLSSVEAESRLAVHTEGLARAEEEARCGRGGGDTAGLPRQRRPFRSGT